MVMFMVLRCCAKQDYLYFLMEKYRIAFFGCCFIFIYLFIFFFFFLVVVLNCGKIQDRKSVV